MLSFSASVRQKAYLAEPGTGELKYRVHLALLKKVSQWCRKKDEVKRKSQKKHLPLIFVWLRRILGIFLGMFADGREDVRGKKEVESGMKGRKKIKIKFDEKPSKLQEV